MQHFHKRLIALSLALFLTAMFVGYLSRGWIRTTMLPNIVSLTSSRPLKTALSNSVSNLQLVGLEVNRDTVNPSRPTCSTKTAAYLYTDVGCYLDRRNVIVDPTTEQFIRSPEVVPYLTARGWQVVSADHPSADTAAQPEEWQVVAHKDLDRVQCEVIFAGREDEGPAKPLEIYTFSLVSCRQATELFNL